MSSRLSICALEPSSFTILFFSFPTCAKSSTSIYGAAIGSHIWCHFFLVLFSPGGLLVCCAAWWWVLCHVLILCFLIMAPVWPLPQLSYFTLHCSYNFLASCLSLVWPVLGSAIGGGRCWCFHLFWFVDWWMREMVVCSGVDQAWLSSSPESSQHFGQCCWCPGEPMESMIAS